VQVPDYHSKEGALKEKGADSIIFYCVNDGAVMDGWAKASDLKEDSILCFLGDPRLELTEKLGLVLNHPYPMSLLGTARCKRFSMLIVDGVIRSLHVAESEDDPAGDDHPEVSLVEQMLLDFDNLNN